LLSTRIMSSLFGRISNANPMVGDIARKLSAGSIKVEWLEGLVKIPDTTFIATAVNICVFFAASSAAIADCSATACQGDLRQPGGTGLYKYVTTSRIYAGHNVIVYETCVENHSNRDMEFNWFIPGPDTTVPKGYSCSNPRPKLFHTNAETYDGCLYYGNDWARARATFLPHGDDKAKIDAETKNVDCKIEKAEFKSGEEDHSREARLALAEGIKTEADAFAPTNVKDPSATMAYLRADVFLGLDAKDDNKYVHHITFRATSFRDSKPDLSVLKLVPESTSLVNLKSDAPDGYVKVASEFSLSDEFSIPKLPTIESVRFFVVGDDNQKLATLFIPYLVESK
jgi:hypothetical protein